MNSGGRIQSKSIDSTDDDEALLCSRLVVLKRERVPSAVLISITCSVLSSSQIIRSLTSSFI